MSGKHRAKDGPNFGQLVANHDISTDEVLGNFFYWGNNADKDQGVTDWTWPEKFGGKERHAYPGPEDTFYVSEEDLAPWFESHDFILIKDIDTLNLWHRAFPNQGHDQFVDFSL